LLSAAKAGMDLRDLGRLFAEMYERSRPDLPDEDPARAVGDRGVRLELTEAASKQIIPLLRRPAREGQSIPDAAAERNWIFFDDNAEFDSKFGQLIQVLDTDLDWVKAHARLQVRARDWAAGGSDRSALPRGKDLRDAEEWRADSDAHPATPPTPGQRQFIAASRRAADRTTRLQRLVLAAGLVIALLLTSLALVQTHRADLERNQAIQERNQAIQNQTVSEALQLATSNPSLAAQLNLAAYRMKPTSDLASRLIGTENTPLFTPVIAARQPVESVAFNPSGHVLASASDDGAVRLWDVADPLHPQPLGQPLTVGGGGPANTVAFSPDGRILASGGNHDGSVQLWDLTNLTHPKPFGHPPTVSNGDSADTVAFGPDARTLATSYGSGVQFWDITHPADPLPLGQAIASGPATPDTPAWIGPRGHTMATIPGGGNFQLWDVANPGHPRSGQSLTRDNFDASALAFSPDGHLVAGSSPEGTIQLWNVADPSHPRALGQPVTASTTNVDAVAFSSNGRLLADADINGMIRLWDMADPSQPQQIGQPLAVGIGINTLAFSPDGQTLATGGNDGTIRLWTIPLTTLVASTSSIQASSVAALAFSPDGRLLADGDSNGMIRLWDMADPAQPRPISQPLVGSSNSGLDTLAFSPDGHTLAVGNVDGTISLWRLNVDDAEKWICATTRNILTPQQWRTYIPQLPYQPPCSQ
jgi:WD40 repeat protein